MPSYSLRQLHDLGQAIWLDFIERTMLHDGELARRIREDYLTGMTSNPTIFEKALAESAAYDEQLSAAPGELTAWQLFELIETDDVRAACDLFRPVYDSTSGGDGFVSIEVSPGAANDADSTVAEARRLWATVDRPNVLIKVPGTPDGALAVRRLIADGINVNITLLFAIEAYRSVIEAYLGGLEDRVRAGKDVGRIASVASFFVSRVDTEVDRRIETRLAQGAGSDRARLEALRGRAAVANARLAYALFREMSTGARWTALARGGARLQRPLWASTSTKNPAYRDVVYVEQLIGPDTVNTMTPATVEAFRDHGVVARTVDQNLADAGHVLSELSSLGISLSAVTDKLLKDGIGSFQKSFDTLLAQLEQKLQSLAAR